MGAECGKRIRLGRVLDPKSGRAVVVAFDHGLDNGPMRGNGNPRAAIARLVEGGADALLVSPGIARLCGDLFVGKTAPGLIVRLDWSNTFRATERLGFEEGRTRLIADVDDAARLGADAVLTYLLIGYSDPDVEADEVAKNARVSRACERLGIPHVMEPMARGDRARGRELDVGLIKVHARIAAELGAEKVLVQKSGYFSRSAAANAADLALIRQCTNYAVDAALRGESGVVGEDEERGDELRVIEFERISGGKKFDVSTPWFTDLLRELGQA